MSRTNYEAVSESFGHWAGLAFDRRHRSNVKSSESHCSRTTSENTLARAWRGPGAGLVRAWCGPGAGLARAWRGPGAGLARAWCGPGAP